MSKSIYPTMRGDEDFFADDVPEYPEMSLEESFHADVRALLRVCWKALKSETLPKNIHDDLAERAGNVGVYFESDDPRESGWIGDDGRP